MKLPATLKILLLGLIRHGCAKPQPQRVLLSSIKTLTLRHGLKTSHNRVPALPQLKCVGGTAKGFYDIDVLRCKNAGFSYDDSNVEWTCTASLPAEFKLGSTDVICEGFSGPDDPYVLKGSCGVEYRLMLTAAGEDKYGGKDNESWLGFGDRTKEGSVAVGIFWLAFVGILIWMIYAACFRGAGGRQRNRAGFGGGGGNDDPPPPYDYHPPPAKTRAGATSRAARQVPGQTEWRPGFWTGALGGAAAGYMAGNRGSQIQQEQSRNQRMWGNGESSSSGGGGRARASESSSSSSAFGTARHESTGFGSTTRR